MTKAILDKGGFAFSEKYLSIMPVNRQEKAMRYAFCMDRRLCISSYLLLCAMCLELGTDIRGYDIMTGRYGKPYLPAFPKLEFNLTHCHSCVACAVSDSSVGIDVEEIVSVKPEFAKLLFHQEEMRLITAAPFPEDEMTRVWTVHEAIGKYTGRGLSEGYAPAMPEHATIISERVSKDIWLSVCCKSEETPVIVTSSDCEKALSSVL